MIKDTSISTNAKKRKEKVSVKRIGQMITGQYVNCLKLAAGSYCCKPSQQQDERGNSLINTLMYRKIYHIHF